MTATQTNDNPDEPHSLTPRLRAEAADLDRDCTLGRRPAEQTTCNGERPISAGSAQRCSITSRRTRDQPWSIWAAALPAPST